jgi:hypothetical protein
VFNSLNFHGKSVFKGIDTKVLSESESEG